MVETVRLDRSDVVFVGYGVQAPEFGWDDYKGVDLSGKTMVVLIGDPPVPDPADPAKLDPKVFGGSAMTYYGRWTYKFEMAQKMGAAAVLIVHETGPAGYAFSVVQVKTARAVRHRAAGRQHDAGRRRGVDSGSRQAKALFALAGRDFDAEKARAATRDFTPVPLGVKASITLKNTLRTVDVPERRREDRGQRPEGEGRVRALHVTLGPLRPGRAAQRRPGLPRRRRQRRRGRPASSRLRARSRRMPIAPRRSVLFVAVTAEEQGMLGSEYYASNPVWPLEKTLAVINLEMLNVHGKTRDLTVVGLGLSDLDDVAAGSRTSRGAT